MSTLRRSGRRPTWLRLLLVATLVLVSVYVVWTLPGVRPRPGFDVLFDGVLQGCCYSLIAVIAVIAVLRARRRRTTGAVWWCVVAALVLRAAAFDLSLVLLSLGRTLPYPSVADAAWVLSSLALFVAMALRLRTLAPRLTPLVVMDGAAAVLVSLGLAVNALAGAVRTLTHGGATDAAVVMNVAYPVLDTALLVVAAALVTARRRLTVSDVVLLVGVVAFAVVDIVFFVLLAEGLWRPGTLLASLSVVATALIAGAVIASEATVQPERRRVGDPPVAELATGIVVPTLLLGLLLVVLALSGYVIPAVGAALACYGTAGILAISRVVLTVRAVRLEAGRAVGEASEDLHLFKSLVDASGELIGMADETGRLLYLNPSGRRMLRVPPTQDVTDLHVGDLVVGDEQAAFDQRWPRLVEGRGWSGEAELTPVDDSAPVPVEISTFAVGDTDQGGRPVMATIQRDITDRLRTQRALNDLSEQRAQLLHRLVQAQEDERARIAHDVHDDPVQALAAVDLRLGLLRRRLATELPDTAGDVDTLHEIVAGATERLRHLLFDLEALPEETSLRDALSEAAAFIFAGTDIDCRVTGASELALSEAERVSVHRIVKEALVNVRKHAAATSVVVDLEQRDGCAVVTVDDDGRGIRPGDDRDVPGHLGLSGMRDRAQVTGADLDVGRRPEGGTRVRLTLPVGDHTPLAGR